MWYQTIITGLAICIATLPLGPVTAMATEPGGKSSLSQEDETARIVVLNDHKKEAVNQDGETKSKKTDDTHKSVPILKEQKKNQVGDIAVAAHKNPEPAEAAEESEEGLPTIAKIGIGVGAAAVVGIALAMSGGSKDSGPKMPTPEILIGKWNGQGTSYEDNRTYYGVYDLYAIGNHTYDIYVTGDDVHKLGHGSWTLIEGTNTLQLENDTGSVYVGDFQNEDFTTITMTTTNGNWGLVLTKQ